MAGRLEFKEKLGDILKEAVAGRRDAERGSREVFLRRRTFRRAD